MPQDLPQSDAGERPHARRPMFVFSLAMLTALTATAIDITLPAQPMIAGTFGERAAAGGLIVSTYMVGYGPGQLLWGPLADKYGRMKPLFIGLAGFILTSLLCVFATSLEMLATMRFFQGIFGGCGPIIARAITRDQGGGEETARLLTTISMIFGIAPLTAPLIGSGIILVTGWQGIFWFLVIFAIALIVISHRYVTPATREKQGITRTPLTWALVKRLIMERDFIMGTLVLTTIFGGYGAMLSVGALMTNAHYGISAQEFGPLFATAAVALIISPNITRYLMAKYHMRTPLKVGAATIGISGLAFLMMANISVPLTVYWFFVFTYMGCFGLIMPISNAMALEPAADAAGTASSLLSALPTIGAAAGSALATSAFFASSYQALSLIMATGGISTFLLVMTWHAMLRKKT